jgi:hypothetical protein
MCKSLNPIKNEYSEHNIATSLNKETDNDIHPLGLSKPGTTKCDILISLDRYFSEPANKTKKKILQNICSICSYARQ